MTAAAADHDVRRLRRLRRCCAAVLSVTAGLAALGACGTGSGSEDSEPELSVRGAYMPAPVTAGMAGGFLTVQNSGGADRLTSVESSDFGEAQLHKTSGGQMQQVKSLPVPANGTLRLSRGGNHIMFLKPERKPEQGEKVRVTLRFKESGEIKVSMPVKATNFVPEK